MRESAWSDARSVDGWSIREQWDVQPPVPAAYEEVTPLTRSTASNVVNLARNFLMGCECIERSVFRQYIFVNKVPVTIAR